MSESQKGKSVQRNQVVNQKQRNQKDEINGNEESETSEQSSGTEGEEGLTEEMNGQESFKRAGGQTNPATFSGNDKSSL